MRNTQYQTVPIQTLEGLDRVLAGSSAPVLLLEGIRALPESDRASVVAMGALVARRWPQARFRSGNADGTDTAFAQGVASVAPERMEYVLTHAGMGRSRRHVSAQAFSLDDMPHAAEDLSEYTVLASPNTSGLVAAYQDRGRSGPLGAKAAYLLRDTAKVMGAPSCSLAPATAGLFYVNPDDPLSGGTGHTIRVCIRQGVPVVTQNIWRLWL